MKKCFVGGVILAAFMTLIIFFGHPEVKSPDEVLREKMIKRLSSATPEALRKVCAVTLLGADYVNAYVYKYNEDGEPELVAEFDSHSLSKVDSIIKDHPEYDVYYDPSIDYYGQVYFIKDYD